MRQLRESGDDVADGVDAGLCRLLRLVDLDKSAVELDACLVEANILRARRAAHGDEDLFGFLLDGFAVCADPRHLHASFGLFNLFDLCAGVDIDAALLEDARQFLRNFFIFGRDHTRQELDES